MIPFAANATAKAEMKIANAFEWPGQTPKLPLPLGLSHPARGGASHGHRTNYSDQSFAIYGPRVWQYS